MAKAKSGAARKPAARHKGPSGEEAQSRELVLSGYGGRPQARSGRKLGWSQAKADKFIEVLAESCNVSLAARAIKRSLGTVYNQRAKSADFRGQWDQALAIGYARLEMMMLERALHGVEKIVVLKSGESKVMREYPDRIALALLRMHRESAAAADDGVDSDDYQEACDRIIERLERLRERDAEEDSEQAVETKQAVDRLALMLWGLRRQQTDTGPRPSPGNSLRKSYRRE